MNASDKKQFGAIMQGLAEDKGVQLSTAGVALKFEALKAFNIEDIQKAAISLMASKKFSTMPSVADFVEHLQGGTAEDIAQYQASVVWQAVRKYGGNRSVCFDDPVTQAVIVRSFGGWQKMCSELMEDQQKWFIKDFVKAYSAFQRRGVKEFGALPGRADPYKCDGPAMIGNQAKALLVYQAAEKPKELTHGLVYDLAQDMEIPPDEPRA